MCCVLGAKFRSVARYSSRKRLIHGARALLSFIGASARVLLEATIRLLEQLRGHGEESLRCTKINMAEIRGQGRKQTLYVRILSVPFRQPMNRECVSQIMKPGLEVGIVATLDACDPSQAREACTGNLGGDRVTALRLKQWSIVLVSSSRLPEVLPDQPREIRSEWHEA